MQAEAVGGAGTRATIGIVAGSGPEAGLDLWAKVLRHNQAAFGAAFRGDLDAPRVVAVSEPDLGLSMDLAANDAAVWAALRRVLSALSPQVDAFAIACNTLNWYAPRIAALDLDAEFISFQSAIADWIGRTGTARVALLGAAPVTAMGDWSAYRDLRDLVEVEVPADSAALHRLIEDVKRLGSAEATLRPRFKALVESLSSDVVLLACTELPLIADIGTDRTLVDVTDLVAAKLAERSLRRPVRRDGDSPQA